MLRRTPLLRTTRLKKAGKKVKRWAKVRRSLKAEFLRAGITRCEGGWEGCMRDDGLTFAHSLKRRHITSDALMREVACLCLICHNRIEVMGEEKMSRIVRGIIEGRAVRLAGEIT